MTEAELAELKRLEVLAAEFSGDGPSAFEPDVYEEYQKLRHKWAGTNVLGILLAEVERLRAENEKLRGALEYGLNRMMPEIHDQRTSWPGEVDGFEDRAREALNKEDSDGS